MTACSPIRWPGASAWSRSSSELGIADARRRQVAVGAFAMDGLRHSHQSWSDLRPGPLISAEQVALAAPRARSPCSGPMCRPLCLPRRPKPRRSSARSPRLASREAASEAWPACPPIWSLPHPGRGSRRSLPAAGLRRRRAQWREHHEASVLTLGRHVAGRQRGAHRRSRSRSRRRGRRRLESASTRSRCARSTAIGRRAKPRHWRSASRRPAAASCCSRPATCCAVTRGTHTSRRRSRSPRSPRSGRRCASTPVPICATSAGPSPTRIWPRASSPARPRRRSFRRPCCPPPTAYATVRCSPRRAASTRTSTRRAPPSPS